MIVFETANELRYVFSDPVSRVFYPIVFLGLDLFNVPQLKIGFFVLNEIIDRYDV